MASLLAKNKRYFNFLSHFYDLGLYYYFGPLYKKTINLIESESKNSLKNGIKFLDIACGTGLTLKRLAKKYPKSIFYGVDVSPGMLKVAKGRNKSRNNINLLLEDAESLPFKDGFFDFIVLSETLHHLEDPNRFFEEMLRVLKKGGYFLLMEPIKIEFFEKPIIKKLILWFDPSPRYYSASDILDIFNKYKLSIVRNFYYYFNNFVLGKKTDSSESALHQE